MRYISLLMLTSFIFCQVVVGQAKKCKIVVTINTSAFPKDSLQINLKGDTTIERLVKGRTTSFIVNCKEPFWYYIELTHKGRMLTGSSAFMTNTPLVKIEVKDSLTPVFAKGGDNEFIAKHPALLFDLPHSITSMQDFRLRFVKEKYEFQPDNIRLRAYWREYEINLLDIVAAKKNSYFVLCGINNIKEQLPLKTLDSAMSLFTEEVKSTNEGKLLQEYVKQARFLFAGQSAPSFTVFNELDQPHPSSTIYSSKKYIFLDFWASWCGPCRQSMKELKTKYYGRIDTSKLQFVSISIDADKAKWLNAAKEENIVWGSYLASGGDTGEVAKKFNLNFIPQNIIIGPDGKIVASNLWGDALELFLREHSLLND